MTSYARSVLIMLNTVCYALLQLLLIGFPRALESWKTWKITKKSSMHGKIMEFEKT